MSEQDTETWFKAKRGPFAYSWCVMATRRGLATVLAYGMLEVDCDRVIADHNSSRKPEASVEEKA